MKFSHRHYVPCLNWKKGEYDAVGQLSETAKELITPLIEVPEIGYDFARHCPPKSIDDHLAPFAGRVRQKWANRNAFVDARHVASSGSMADGTHPMEFVLNELKDNACPAVPVTDCTRNSSYQDTVRKAIARDKHGVCFRISIQSAASRSIDSEIDELLKSLKVRAEQVDFILDLGAPNFVPIASFSKAIFSIIGRLPHLKLWRTFTLLGTSFPASMGEVKRGVTCIPRNEWLLYKTVVNALGVSGIRMPAFGDYAVNHPDQILLDPRLLKPSATIRYAVDDAWLIIKGTSVRQPNGFDQFYSHSATVCASDFYMGSDYSAGDNYISQCAVKKAGKGNLTTWRQVGTNHHLEKVAMDVATLSYA